MFGGVSVHPQHKRYESTTYHPWHSSKPPRFMCIISQQWPLLSSLSWLLKYWRSPNFWCLQFGKHRVWSICHQLKFNVKSLQQAKTMIPAHDSPLAAIAFSSTGTLIATASEKGTVIRIFKVSDGARLHEFRRGVKRCATIYSLAFSADSNFLVASSNTETVHVFRLETTKDA